MQRDHLFNRSTRPLLDSPPKSHFRIPTATIMPQIKKEKKSSMNVDYKLHGFNDFNFVANQYKNLNRTHTGYPYGSPPSTPNTSTYEDSMDVSTSYYDDDSGIHTNNNSSENFSCRSNYSPTINFFGDPINDCNSNCNINGDDDGIYNSMGGMNNINGQYNNNNTTMHKEFSVNNNMKKGFLKEWSRFGANNHHHHHHHKLTNYNEHNNQQTHQTNQTNQTNQTQSEQRHLLHYNSNKINSIQTPNPVDRLLDNGPFIFGVHSNTCYTLPSKNSTKCDSVIKHSNGASVRVTKYTPIDPDANTDDEQDIYGRRCDATVINDNAQNDTNTKHMLASATVENATTKEYERIHKKIAEKNRIKAAEKLTKVKKKRTKTAATTTTTTTVAAAAAAAAAASTTTKAINAIKCVVVGDGTVGKTNLISAYLQHRFTTEHVPTASDIYNFEVKVDDRPVQVTLCDTAGQDFLDPLRRLCYPDSDVFVLCFSVIKPDTFVAVREKWMPIFRKSQTPIVLIGTQSDLRHDSAVVSELLAKNEKPVSKSDAWDYATLIGAKYIETSSRANINVKEAFDTAIWHALVSMNESRKSPFWKRLLCFI